MRAQGIKTPAQPTQDRAEHELTHLPYRSWYNLRAKDRTARSPQSTAEHAASDTMRFHIHQGLSSQHGSVSLHSHRRTNQHGHGRLHDKTQQLQYLQKWLQKFLSDCGRSKANANSAVLQSDEEDLLITVLKATALAFGGNMRVRQKPAYSSQQSQGSVDERYHATFAAQIRTLPARVEKNYNTIIGARHLITPWIVQQCFFTGIRLARIRRPASLYMERLARLSEQEQ